MTGTLAAAAARWLAAPVAAPVATMAERLACEAGAEAVLFYGSNLRTGDLEGVLDFYVLLPGAPERGLWPAVGYREVAHGTATLRAKIATMRLSTFASAAAGGRLDTTIWTRFAQPAALAWSRSPDAAAAVARAVAGAAATAARFAALLGPAEGTPDAFWRALFRQTYRAELRVERAGREEQLLGHHPAHWPALLPLAWEAAGIAFAEEHGRLRPALPAGERRRLARAWVRRRRAGRPLNAVRLVRAAFTFDGAARYAAWKIERHTGVPVPLTPWRERHPLLAAPGVLWRLWRARRPAAA